MHKKRLIPLILLIVLVGNLAFLPGIVQAGPAEDASYTWGNGADGDLTIAAGNTYNIHTSNHPGRTCSGGGDGVAYQVIGLTPNTATLNTSPSAGCLAIGDEVMLINEQGSSTNTGNYELLRIKTFSANLITFTTNKTTFFGAHAGDDSGLSSGQHVVLQRVPNYNNLTLNGNLVANGWNGLRFGLIAFKVKGNWIGSGNINLDAAGYRGGAPNSGGARQGESWPGMGVVSASANGGGGAGRAAGDAGCPGGQGNYAGGVVNQVCTTPNGAIYGSAPLTRIIPGSGGGGRSDGTGGNGGGVVFAAGNNINFLGTITVRGQDGQSTGAGSGGSIRIEGAKLVLGSLSAMGAKGMNGAASGVGRIALYYVNSLSISSSKPAPYTQKVSTNPTASPSATSSKTPNIAQTATSLSLTLTAQNTPNYNATGTALAQTMTAQPGTPDYNATGTALAQTSTALAGKPDYNATGTALAQTSTALAGGTPDYNATGTALAQTATALAGTPDYNATGTALAQTATAFSQTDTPTPDYNATATSDALTATAQAMNTPTPDFFASATALSRTATAFAASPTPDLNATGTAQSLTATAAVTTTPTPDLNATGTARAQTATAAATSGTPSSSNNGSSSDGGTPTPSSLSSAFGTSCNNMALNVYVYIDGNKDSMMAAAGEGVNGLEVDFLDTSYGKVGQSYTFNGKSSFCIPDYMRGQTLRVDIPYLQRTGVMQASQDGTNKNQPLEMWFRLDPPTLPIYIP